MKLKPITPSTIGLAVSLIGCLWLITYAYGPIDTFPRLHASAKSPDGEFAVTVYRKRLHPLPIFPRMGVMVRIFDQQGRLVYDRVIHSDSDHDNYVGQAFTQIRFEGDEIRIGPGFYDPNQIFLIKKTDLQRQK